MARGKPFAVIATRDPAMDMIQSRVWDVFDQLEDSRRGMLVSSVLALPSSASLSEQLVVVYTGKGSDTLRLPPANLRSSGRGQVLFLANQGTGSVTLAPSGRDTLNGATSVPVNGTAVLWSDGSTKWHELPAYVLPANVVLSTRSLLSTADILLDGAASNTVDLSANRTIGLANAGPGAGALGSAASFLQTVTLDAKGRVTAGAAANTVTGDLDCRRQLQTQGTATVAGDYALSAGWGTTASVTVATGSRDSRGRITVNSAGTGQAANPTITFTFKNGAYGASPFAIVKRNGGTGVTTEPTWTSTTTTLVITWPGTPVAASGYIFEYLVAG